MYLVELTPAEIWIGIAIFTIIIVAIRIESRRVERKNAKEWEDILKKKDEEVAQFKEFFAQYKKEHPEIWDEDGNLRGSTKTVRGSDD